MAHYLIFGDSITAGEGDPKGGWVRLLQEYLYETDCVFNLGISGDTSNWLLARFEAELKPRLSPLDPNIVIVAIGINDSVVMSGEQYLVNLRKLLMLARKYTPQVIFIGPTPIDEEKAEKPWDQGKLLTYKSVAEFNQLMFQLAKTEKIKFIDLFNNLPPQYLQTLPDGVHPDTAGNLMIFNLIKSVLK